MKTRFFCVAVEGDTADGRVIEGRHIDEMAASYNPATYAARVNMEHIRGFSAEPPFNAYGDVLAVEKRTIDLELNGKTEKRAALFAAIEPTAALKDLNAKRQKLFTSCEISPNFASTGKAYLVGLAVTDSPASLGTEMLQFAAGLGDNSPLAARKLDKANLFTATGSHVLDLTPAETPAPAADPAKPSLLSQVLAAIGATPSATPPAAPAAPAAPATPPAAPAAPAAPATPVPANDNFTAVAALLAGSLDANRADADAKFAAIQADLQKLTATLSNEADPSQTRRPPVTGPVTGELADC